MTDLIRDTATPARAILVVEDDLHLRHLIESVLLRAGYSVHLASDGASALASLAACGETLSVVYLDLVLPDMPGEQVLARIRALHPTLPVLVVSGDDLPSGGVTDLASTEFLAKPFFIHELHDALGRVLASRSGGAPRLGPATLAA